VYFSAIRKYIFVKSLGEYLTRCSSSERPKNEKMLYPTAENLCAIDSFGSTIAQPMSDLSYVENESEEQSTGRARAVDTLLSWKDLRALRHQDRIMEASQHRG